MKKIIMNKPIIFYILLFTCLSVYITACLSPCDSEGFLIATTPEQDKKMEKGALNVLNQDYDVLTSNCAQTVQRALKYGGLNPGNGLRPKINVYPSIVKNNKGAQILIYNPQLSPKKW